MSHTAYWWFFAKTLYGCWAGATFMYYWVTGGGMPGDYEELCAQVGASVLCFITWPISLWLWRCERHWRKINARKNDIADLAESLARVTDSPTHDALASSLNTKYKLVCADHPVEDCQCKRSGRQRVLDLLREKHGKNS